MLGMWSLGAVDPAGSTAALPSLQLAFKMSEGAWHAGEVSLFLGHLFPLGWLRAELWPVQPG